MASIDDSPLGKSSAYPSEYAPQLLYPIARSQSRGALVSEAQTLPFFGEDVWTGFELSWLNTRGLPQVAMLEFRLPCESDNIVESKSIKLYLNSFNQSRFAGAEEVKACIAGDLSAAAGAEVEVKVYPLRQLMPLAADFSGAPFNARCLDQQDIAIDTYSPDAALLTTLGTQTVSESWYSDLLKSNCPVTGQPDWASVWIYYSGKPIDPAGLLRYVVSFREHQDFHEHCVERMFCDIMRRCEPQELEVYARYTRRGGLDINPYRSSSKGRAPQVRLVRQ